MEAPRWIASLPCPGWRLCWTMAAGNSLGCAARCAGLPSAGLAQPHDARDARAEAARGALEGDDGVVGGGGEVARRAAAPAVPRRLAAAAGVDGEAIQAVAVAHGEADDVLVGGEVEGRIRGAARQGAPGADGPVGVDELDQVYQGSAPDPHLRHFQVRGNGGLSRPAGGDLQQEEATRQWNETSISTTEQCSFSLTQLALS